MDSCNGSPRSFSLVLPLLFCTGLSVYLLTSKMESYDEGSFFPHAAPAPTPVTTLSGSIHLASSRTTTQTPLHAEPRWHLRGQAPSIALTASSYKTRNLTSSPPVPQVPTPSTNSCHLFPRPPAPSLSDPTDSSSHHLHTSAVSGLLLPSRCGKKHHVRTTKSKKASKPRGKTHHGLLEGQVPDQCLRENSFHVRPVPSPLISTQTSPCCPYRESSPTPGHSGS